MPEKQFQPKDYFWMKYFINKKKPTVRSRFFLVSVMKRFHLWQDSFILIERRRVEIYKNRPIIYK